MWPVHIRENELQAPHRGRECVRAKASSVAAYASNALPHRGCAPVGPLATDPRQAAGAKFVCLSAIWSPGGGKPSPPRREEHRGQTEHRDAVIGVGNR